MKKAPEYVIDCHVCSKEMDVTAQVKRLNSNGLLQLVGKTCEHCQSKNTIVITMMSGLQVVEKMQRARASTEVSAHVSKDETDLIRRELRKAMSEIRNQKR